MTTMTVISILNMDMKASLIMLMKYKETGKVLKEMLPTTMDHMVNICFMLNSRMSMDTGTLLEFTSNQVNITPTKTVSSTHTIHTITDDTC